MMSAARRPVLDMPIAGEALAALLPHAPPILALEAILAADDASLLARARASRDSPFCEGERGVPFWVALEFMGQAVAALEGLKARRVGRPPPVGYLLGTRRMAAGPGQMPADAELLVRVVEAGAGPDGLAAFDGCVSWDGGELACRFSVYRRDGGDTRA
jgi:predicted hotdog family 3-hydroxylacyl-ACP dehydratase